MVMMLRPVTNRGRRVRQVEQAGHDAGRLEVAADAVDEQFRVELEARFRQSAAR